MDLELVVDSSRSMGVAGFNATLHFLTDVVDRLVIGANKCPLPLALYTRTSTLGEYSCLRSRVGLVEFSSSAAAEFYLDSFFDAAALDDALLHSPFLAQGTNIALVKLKWH